MSDAFKRAWVKTHLAEGGYSDHPNDPGGKTNHGITERVARANGFKGDMRDLSVEKAEEIAKREYWDVMRLDEVAALSGRIAHELFDTNFNMWTDRSGGRAAIYFLQRQLNALNKQHTHYADVAVDGKIGLATLTALHAYLARRGKEGELVLLRGLNAEQACDYRRQTEANELKEDFYYGWLLNRVVI